MKKYLLIATLFVFFLGFSQNNHIVKTENGRRVLLKADFTWEYIDLVEPKNTPNQTVDFNDKEAVANRISNSSAKKGISKNCNTSKDFKEPKGNRIVQAYLKKGRATIKHIKKKVAKDNKCSVEDVLLLRLSEQKMKGSYTFCANGKKVEYKRTGYSYFKKWQLF